MRTASWCERLHAVVDTRNIVRLLSDVPDVSSITMGAEATTPHALFWVQLGG